MIMDEIDPVKRWLDTCPRSKNTYGRYFKQFEEYVGKSGAQMLKEQRELIRDPETADVYAEKLYQFYGYLLSGEVKCRARGSIKGRSGGWSGKYADKPISQGTAHTTVSSVQSFFAFYNMEISLKKYTKRNAKMRKPQPEKQKHQLLENEIDSLIKAASLRDRAILCLGLMGQDESTVSGLAIEQFNGRLNAERLEFLRLLRPKTNEKIVLLLTPEVQQILSTYIKSLGKAEDWLFPGYKDRHIQPSLCDDIFKKLCEMVQVQQQDDEQLSFHCCRKWFSAQLRNRVSDDLIDLLTGHAVRFEGAYLGNLEKTRETLTDANVTNLLKLQSERAPVDEVRKKSLMDFAKLQGFNDEKLKRLEEVLARSKNVDEGIQEFRRFQEEGESEVINGDGRYCVVHGEMELMQKLSNNWKLVQSLNGDKYLLQNS
jgi:integrase